jgi:Ulp1 family protease
VVDDMRRKKYFIDTMKTQYSPSKVNLLYIIPLHSNDHWSLLVRMPKIKRWFHFDSIPGYHRSFAIRLADRVDKEIYNIGDKEEEEFDFIYFKNVPQQNSNWECGIYLLMYAFIMIHYTTIYNYDETDDAETIRTDVFDYLRKHLKQLDNNKCKSFAASIVDRLKA